MFIYKDYINKKICEKLIDVYENDNNKILRKDNITHMNQVYLSSTNSSLINYNSALNKILEKYIKKYIEKLKYKNMNLANLILGGTQNQQAIKEIIIEY